MISSLLLSLALQFHGTYIAQQPAIIDAINRGDLAVARTALHNGANPNVREILTTVTFKALGDQTELTLTWEPIDVSEAELKCFEQGLEGCRAGWGSSFDHLSTILKGVQELGKSAYPIRSRMP